ncbi:hypothetical protein SDC9_28171 [bioreactor metagenome]|jgi:hypothetical protein|uniref:Secretion system C-terminal sorting domain-containing protein n=1 Tax=bioreactor metagenome TaxID=1076179 RepID=A0A644UT30_9ZZZZ|nr:hypothetical protein [Lentimicrobium sp.]MEA5109828.1 hypothetical protein [Lentimicrobium sp.]
MKTFIFATAIAMMLSISLQASTGGKTGTMKAKVHIFQTNTESVDVYVAKIPGQLVKVTICSESGTPLMKTRIKKQGSRYLRYHLNELPAGTYNVLVEQDGEVISEMNIQK